MLIAANVVVFLGELLYTSDFSPCLASQFFYAYGLVPFSLIKGVQLVPQCGTNLLYVAGSTPAVYLTLLTSMFIHTGYLHIAGNMLFLFVFGANIEDRLGRPRYLASYVACGIAGGVAMIVTSMAAGPPNIYIPGVGASGAISGVMAAYLVLYPRTPVLSIIGYFLMPVRAYWFIMAWFVLQVLFQVGGQDTGVAYAAHIGGFALGLMLAAAVKLTSKPTDE